VRSASAPRFSVAPSDDARPRAGPAPEVACVDLWERGLSRENDLPTAVLKARIGIHSSQVTCDEGTCTLVVDYRYRIGWYDLELHDEMRAQREVTASCTRLFMSGIVGLRTLPTWRMAHPSHAEAVRAFQSAFDVEPRELLLVDGHPTMRLDRVLGADPVHGRCGIFSLDLVTGERGEAPRPCGPPTPRPPLMCGDDPHMGGRCRGRD